ncbi:hypothetical protein [Streptomyces megasporus]|uniref:hypothetical protein n=1 Tax=Streptomyces megasporus TaxID=44060 RepID=UPI0004E14F47|nr:hypothetical protein [Streptomyces megasporus]
MAGIRVGKPQVQPDRAAHVRGIRQGNQLGSYRKAVGHLPDDRSTARRSTGINARRRDPIMPGMPNLSPS